MTSLRIGALIAVTIVYVIAKFAGLGVLALMGVGGFVALSITVLVLFATGMSTWRSLRFEPSVVLRHE